MVREIKKFFLNFIKLNKKGLILALLFFVIFGLVFSSQPAFAQLRVPGLGCAWYNVPCLAANFILSVMLKIVVLIFFGIPLLLSALFVGIMSLILGWIIGPYFISLKFTQNPFVDIGLSITRGFANMGFILFLVVIALATALRIEEYKAKKTLPTLIIIALLINFSPVFCGIIIDASNIVMNFFLENITGLTGFVNFIYAAATSLWNLLWSSGFDLQKNIAAAMQIIISLVFNFFAGFIFILFSALFIMRYIMLWILVILSPIAFVSYILPITRRGRSLLSWRTWWEQLIAWSIIGIIAGFFLYLGFTMISMINANPAFFVTYPKLSWEGTEFGLMNNVLPYLIPLVLLWIAYRETKRTSAMFAKEIVEMPEKIGKSAVMAGLTVGMAAATAGAGAVAAKLGPTMGKVASGLKTFGKKHRILGAPIRTGEKVGGWAVRKAKPVVGKVKPPLEKVGRKLKIDKAAKFAGRALKGALWEYTREKKVKPSERAIRRRAGEIYRRRLEGKEPGYTYAEIDAMLGKEGMTPGTPEADKFMKKWDWERAKKQLSKRRVKEPGIAKQVIEGTKDAWKDWLKKRLKPPKKRKFTRAEREALEEKGVPSEVLEEFEIEAGGEE